MYMVGLRVNCMHMTPLNTYTKSDNVSNFNSRHTVACCQKLFKALNATQNMLHMCNRSYGLSFRWPKAEWNKTKQNRVD